MRTFSTLTGRLSVCLLASSLHAQAPTVTELMTRSLPHVPGMEVLMITVEYPPGGAASAHWHCAHSFIYVVQGSIVMQVKGGRQVTLSPGQTFYEGTDDIHAVGGNASSTKPARFLVFLVKGRGTPLLVPAQG